MLKSNASESLPSKYYVATCLWLSISVYPTFVTHICFHVWQTFHDLDNWRANASIGTIELERTLLDDIDENRPCETHPIADRDNINLLVPRGVIRFAGTSFTAT